MNFVEIVNWLREKEERLKSEAIQFGEEHLPVLAKIADAAATNPAVVAIMRAEHLNPEWFTSLGDLIDKADAALGVAVQARQDAEAAAAASPAPAAESAA